MELNAQNFDIRDILWKVQRYSWLLALPPVVALCVASIYYKMTPPLFESHVVVSLGDQGNFSPVLQPMVSADRDRGSSGERMVLVDSKVRSEAFLKAVVEGIGLLDDPQIIAEAVSTARRHPGLPASAFAVRIASNEVSRRIRISPIEGQYVRVTTISGTAEGAQRLASVITDLLIEENRRASLERVQARQDFSQDQVAVYQERLRKSEIALQSYQESLLRSRVNRTPVSEDNLGVARGILGATDQEIEQTRARIDDARAQWSRQVPGADPPTLEGAGARDLERRLSSSEVSLAVAILGMERSSREVPVLQSAVTTTRLSLLSEFESLAAALPGNIPDAARMAAAGMATDRAILRTLRAKRDRIASFVNNFERGVENTPREQIELARLQGEVETNRQLLKALQQEAQSSQISEAFATSAMGLRLTVVDPPQLPLGRSAPDPKRIFGMALLIGPLLSVGIVFALEKITTVIRTVEQAETELDFRVLGTVPRIPGWSRCEGYVARRWAAVSIVLVLVLTGIFHGVRATTHSDAPPNRGASQTQQ